MEKYLRLEAELLVRSLKKKRVRLALAESCTGGYVASLLTEIPGVSEFFCGSKVVYRNGSKEKWLGVKSSTLKKHSAVSREVALEMARGVLKTTPEAQIAGAITGDLGPGGEQVGRVFISVLKRGVKQGLTQEFWILPPEKKGAKARKARSSASSAVALRLERRTIAAQGLIFLVRTLLK